MQKILVSLLLSSMVLFSCSKNDVLNDTANETVQPQKNVAARPSALEPIKLYKSWSVNAWVYAGFYTKRKSFYAEVANLAYNKKVSAHHKMADGVWLDIPLKYISSTPYNTEIWGTEYDYSTYITSATLGNEFAMKYEVNQQTYWDNNKGANYTVSGSDGMYLQEGLNVSVDTMMSYFNNYTANNTGASVFNIVTDVRNIAYNKNVNVVYTTDGWKSVKTLPLAFAQYYAIGNGVTLVNPNRFGIERWTSSIAVDPSVQQIQYAVSYKVNGTEYWDNNFGKNYTAILKKY
ncbi:CBM21 domain-containing protein [Ferruginibacter lapsinanis]|uniref:carbohydrate-binding protein n=1 Tax=Ferruginibacter lapsinanis TaxID=563172 RepID=UPI001E29554D|nr:carbohydrate-binding protein [Ferruginibacter lapsinanis]UEG50875.1 CBM21 domain-containing protein [Ferruginibacter lapsinanis]